MVKILGYVVLTLLAAVALLVAYASTRPDSFRIERRLKIAAPPERVFPLVSDLRSFHRWNPWARKDPAMTHRFSGPAGAQVGATYAWQSREQGEGSMALTALEPQRAARYRLDFIKPFAAVNEVEFLLVPDAQGGTEVAWVMSGPSPLVSKVMGLVFNMDRMVGTDFEQGLNNLQQLAKGAAMTDLEFTIDIQAPVARVWQRMFDDASYRDWTSAFCEGSYFEGQWAEGSQLRFLSPGGMGMAAEVVQVRLHERVALRLVAELRDGVVLPDSPLGSHPALESYHFSSMPDGGTRLQVQLQGWNSFVDFLQATWPQPCSA